MPEKLEAALPHIVNWIDETLSQHADQAQPVSSFGFQRLPEYYPADLLDRTKVVLVPKVPVPPLSTLGLPEFSDFVNGDYAGITFKDTCFLKASEAESESLHFHEMVHIVQWAHLSVERFLLAYAAGLAAHGYRDSPLELMAYTLQELFERGTRMEGLEAAICRKLDELHT